MIGNIADGVDALGVYQVYTGSGTGSGFLIDDRHFVTNAHVVAPYRQVAIEMRDRSRVLGLVRRVHPQRDLAMVELERAVDGQVLPLSSSPIRAKQAVHILGFPIGLPLSLTEGVVSHPRQLLDEQYFVQTDAAINPGNSGGPILDDDQKIVAVTTCKLDAADAVGFGIPAADVLRFVEEFRAQEADFGVQCPACEEFIAKASRYCPSCGSKLAAGEEFGAYFDETDSNPVNEFVEVALARSGINPVLARHGEMNWSFYSGSAPIKIWSCCPDHLNFVSPLAQVGRRKLDPLFRYLLSDEHAPYFFSMSGSVIRMSLFVHVSDVFTPDEHERLTRQVMEFITRADDMDDHLISSFGCAPATETHLEVLEESSLAQLPGST